MSLIITSTRRATACPAVKSYTVHTFRRTVTTRVTLRTAISLHTIVNEVVLLAEAVAVTVAAIVASACLVSQACRVCLRAEGVVVAVRRLALLAIV